MTAQDHKDFCLKLIEHLEELSTRHRIGGLTVDSNSTGEIDISDALRYLRYNTERIVIKKEEK